MSRCIATAYKNLRVKMAASLWIGLSLDEYFFDLNSLWANDDNEQGVNRKTIL